MFNTAIKTMLRTALFTGSVGFLPAVALADSGTDKPPGAETTEGGADHATIEAHDVPGNVIRAGDAQTTSSVPDHAAAEARGAGDTTRTNNEERTATVPDHAAAEARTPGGAGR